ncbi:DnaJ homolog subfamily C member 5G [Lemmus lemmus]
MPQGDDASRRLSKTGRSLYTVLELKKGAQPEEVKKAYRSLPALPPLSFGYCLGRKLALQYHPDKNPGDTQAAEFFKEINRAHAILSDPTKKKIYDQHGSLGIYLLDHFGEEGVRYYFIVNSCWFKVPPFFLVLQSKKGIGVGVLKRWLTVRGAFNDLIEDLGAIPSTHMVARNIL